MKILITNWINVLGIFLIVFIYAIFLNIGDENISRTLFQSIFAALLLVALYGLMFWAIFIISLVVLDIFLIVKNQSSLKLKLLIEWLIISSPFIYWTIKYNEQIFLVAIVTFLITQLLREQRIKEIITSRSAPAE